MNDETVLLPAEMEPGQRIAELYAWIATHRNSGEGIVACTLPGLGMTPMVSGRRRAMLSAEPLVRQTIAMSAGRGGDTVEGVALKTFRRVEAIEAEQNRMRAALANARAQIEYLHGKFAATGSGNAVLAEIERALAP